MLVMNSLMRIQKSKCRSDRDLPCISKTPQGLILTICWEAAVCIPVFIDFSHKIPGYLQVTMSIFKVLMQTIFAMQVYKNLSQYMYILTFQVLSVFY